MMRLASRCALGIGGLVGVVVTCSCTARLGVFDEASVGGGTSGRSGAAGAAGSGDSMDSGGAGRTPSGVAGSEDAGDNDNDNGELQPVIDERPAAPPRDLYLPLAEPSWRESSEPFCAKHYGTMQGPIAVWSSERHVYVMHQAGCNPFVLDAERIPCDHAGMSLQFNDGTGWRLLAETAASDAVTPPALFSSLVGGSWPWGDDLYGTSTTLLSFSNVLYDSEYEIVPLLLAPNGDPARWEAGLEPTGELFSVSADLLYALGDTNAVYKWDSVGEWLELARLPKEVRGLWADRDAIVVTGADYSLYVAAADDARFTAMPAPPAELAPVDGGTTALWGFGASDIWLGTWDGRVMHFDGTAYTSWDTGDVGSGWSNVLALWGAEGELFYITPHEFGRVTEGRIEPLLTLAETPFSMEALWGNSPNEVFVTLRDAEGEGYACGGALVLWFDGEALHRL